MGSKTVKKKNTKLAIVGSESKSRIMTPFHDEEWDIWGISPMDAEMSNTRWDGIWEIHKESDLNLYPKDRQKHIELMDIPCYCLHETKHRFKDPVPVPMNEIFNRFPTPWDVEDKRFATSSVFYMVALALIKGYKEIGVFGVNMACETEYENQRPNMLWILGIAQGMGVKVYIPSQSMLFYGGWVYAVDPMPEDEGLLEEQLLIEDIQKLTLRVEDAKARKDRADGAFQQMQQAAGYLQGNDKGRKAITPEMLGESIKELGNNLGKLIKEGDVLDGACQQSKHYLHVLRFKKRQNNIPTKKIDDLWVETGEEDNLIAEIMSEPTQPVAVGEEA